MSGLGKQCQGMGTYSSHNQQHNVGNRHTERNFEHSCRSALGMRVDVHI